MLIDFQNFSVYFIDYAFAKIRPLHSRPNAWLAYGDCRLCSDNFSSVLVYSRHSSHKTCRRDTGLALSLLASNAPHRHTT